MNFGSGLVFANDDDEGNDCFELVDEGTLTTTLLEGMRSVQIDSSGLETRGHSSSAPVGSRGIGRKYRERVDVNVVSIALANLGTHCSFGTGDPISCKKCGVFFSHLSKLTGAGAGAGTETTEQRRSSTTGSSAGGDFQEVVIWKCEFCMHSNPIVSEEIPDTSLSTQDYILAPPPVMEDLPGNPNRQDIGVVIPCVDTSGSMCISSEVDGNVRIRGDAASRLNGLRVGGDELDQWLPNENRNVSYVSRLQCVQGAISSLIDDLKANKADTRVGLVTFSDKVSIHGDGSGQPFVVSGSSLNDFESMVELGKTNKPLSLQSRSIKYTAESLNERLFTLEEGGPTGLGPAVVAAIAGAAEFNLKTNTSNAKVVLATDGLANVGVGSLETDDKIESAVKTHQFYSMVGDWASKAGVTVDVFGIEGENCDIENLGTLADRSGGSVNLVNPINLLTDFGHMMASKKVASDVSVKVYVHSGVEFRGEDVGSICQNENHSHLFKDVGTVTEDTGPLSFEFNVKSASERRKLNCGQLQSLPFQVHVSYTTNDGMRCLRVISDQKNVTRVRDEAEKMANVKLLAGHVQSRCASYAQEGHYTKSRVSARAWGQMFNRAMSQQQHNREEVEMNLQELNEVDNLIGETVKEERSCGDYMSSDDEMDEEVKTRKKFKRKQKRSKNDTLSSKLYNMSKSKQL